MTDAFITYEQLQNAKACRDQLALFKRKFGERVEVTVELAESVAGEFDWLWAAATLLTDAARAEYERATAAAWAEYERATAAAWISSALAEYRSVAAPAFATAYIAQERDDD